MSIRLIAKELYAARRREEALASKLAEASKPTAAEGLAGAGLRQQPLEAALRRARAERRRMEEILAGHIDRGPARG